MRFIGVQAASRINSLTTIQMVTFASKQIRTSIGETRFFSKIKPNFQVDLFYTKDIVPIFKFIFSPHHYKKFLVKFI